MNSRQTMNSPCPFFRNCWSVRLILALIFALLTGPGSLSAQTPANAPQPRIERNVVYGMYSGLALLMDVHYPLISNGFGVISVSGCGWHMPTSYDAPELKDNFLNQSAFLRAPLVEAGYTVFEINHRTAPRFRFPAALEDGQRAVRFVRYHARRFGIRPERIGGTGYASGGHLVALLGVLDGTGDPQDPDAVNKVSAKLQCVVAGAANMDLINPGTQSNRDAVSSFMGWPISYLFQPSKEYQLYQQASPVFSMSVDDAPLMMYHGELDKIVPLAQSERMEQAAIKAGVAVKLLKIERGTHDNLRPEGAADFKRDVLRWFDDQLRGAPEPAQP